MTDDGYFLSAANPVANVDQRRLEDRALRLIRRPEVEKVRETATFLYREVWQNLAGEQMPHFDNTMEEYVFHYAMRATGSDGNYPGVARFMLPAHRWFGRDVPGSRWGGDSPDFAYRILPVAGDGRYVIRDRPTCDKPPTAHYAVMSDNTAAPTIMSLLDGLVLVTESDGSFTITADADPANGRSNHIQLQPGALQIWVPSPEQAQAAG
jgi:hypothetical protein